MLSWVLGFLQDWVPQSQGRQGDQGDGSSVRAKSHNSPEWEVSRDHLSKVGNSTSGGN